MDCLTPYCRGGRGELSIIKRMNAVKGRYIRAITLPLWFLITSCHDMMALREVGGGSQYNVAHAVDGRDRAIMVPKRF